VSNEGVKFLPGQHIHLVGIGGTGMSAIARILVERGFSVSGSDRGSNDMTEALARDGATIYKGHDAAHVRGADMVLITSAVKDDHVEVRAAREAGIPVYKRQDVMAALMEGQKVIAVAGTKGKTTTTSMIVHILRECGADPSYIVGGVMGNTGTNAGVGKGEWFVVEADEYDNMFLGLRPDIAVITNIEWDHPDFFKTPEDMVESFRKFVGLLPDEGLLIRYIGDSYSGELARVRRDEKHLPTTEYSVNYPGATWRTNMPTIDEEGYTNFLIVRYDSDPAKMLKSYVRHTLPGIHNSLNAVAALSSTVSSSISIDCAAKALESFKPTARRFDVRADVNGIAVVDDYAHNPMSIRAVLEATRQRYPDRAVWAVWQPHTYSRTQALFDDFVKAFDQADYVLVTDIYAARENPMEGVTSAGVVAAMQHNDARYTPSFADTVKVLREEVKAPAAIVIMSAGDAPQIGVEYLKFTSPPDPLSMHGEGEADNTQISAPSDGEERPDST
jgi:UDP-N-acetylmuramate--alanine ligase